MVDETLVDAEPDQKPCFGNLNYNEERWDHLMGIVTPTAAAVLWPEPAR